MADAAENAVGQEQKTTSMKTVVTASAAGTAFEWYDFFLYVPLVAILQKMFFAGLNEATATLFALLSFAIGFAFRPIGALIFGRIGDRIGRKATFLVTMMLMGVSTFAIGLLPTYGQVGILAPLLFIGLRILQGLALGGEWGGAAIYIVEHVATEKRGLTSSWLGGSAAFGLGGALLVVLITRTVTGEAAFAEWAWRIPFLFSAALLGISMWIRLRLHESPVFAKMRAEGRRSEHPYRESFLHIPTLKIVLLSLFGIMIAQGAVWYLVFFYGQSFLEGMIKVDPKITNFIMLALTAVSVPMYLFFGWLSDRVGRKPVMLSGIIVILLTVFPGFHLLERFGNPALSQAQATSPVVVIADPANCSLQFDPVGKAQFTSGCDIAKSILAKQGVSYDNEAAPVGAPAQVRVGTVSVASPGGENLQQAAIAALRTDTQTKLTTALRGAGYPEKADPGQTNPFGLFFVLFVLAIGATALYGPQAAALVEMFPARVRYTALSLPYHIGTGWVGGFLPAAAFAIVTTTGDIYAGLWYPFIFAAIAAVVMALFFKETRGRPLDEEDAAVEGPMGPG